MSEADTIVAPPVDLASEGGEVTAVEQEGEEPAPAKPQPKLCGICDKDEGKYKCPRPGCQLP